jgi:outer membrane immunogenic protein
VVQILKLLIMKKIIFLIVSFICVGSFAQSPLGKGRVQFNAGIGASGWGIPVYAGLDFGVAPDITVGVEGSYRSYSQSYFNDKYSSSIIGIGANGNYHFNRVLEIPSKWDLYAGLGLGYYIWNDNYNNNNFNRTNASGIGFGGQVGGRYFFSNNFAVNLELGGASSTSGAKIGITYKFGGGSSSRRTESKPAPAKTTTKKTTTTKPAPKPAPKKKK